MEEMTGKVEENLGVQSVQSEPLPVYGYDRNSPIRKRDEKSATDRKEERYIGTKADYEGWCDSNNGKLLRCYYDSDEHGWLWERKELIKMIDDAKREGVKVVLVKNYSRLARDATLQGTLIGQLRDAGIRVVSIEQPMGETVPMMRQMQAIMDEEYIRDLRQKSERRHAQRLAQGLPIMPAPFGYRYKNKEWMVVSKEAEKVVAVFAMRGQGKTYKQIYEALNIGVNVYYAILKNKEIYEGWIIYRKRIRDFTGKITGIELVKVRGKHQPILDSALSNIPSIVPSPDI